MFLSADAAASRPSRMIRRAHFLVGVSLLAMMVAAPRSYAIDVGSRAAGVTSAPAVASDAAMAAARQAQQAAQDAALSMKRATTSLQSMQSIQAAARAAAQAQQASTSVPVPVPNGLGTGGLNPNLPVGWSGANAPTQAAGTNDVTIRQTQAQAILNWKTFNVSAKTTLTYDQQGNANWVALNRVDATQGPSQILGQIKADGQVYVVNQSGIIFGGASQVNVGSLIASTAAITDAQFKTNGIYSAQNGGAYVPSFTGAGGKVTVERGAQIATSAPKSVTSGGGFVMLLGT
ncbi:MAG TPA: filamentous hemagglutinin N-terminal domain-containing protein, partial [Bradyrhizobium sp.]|nr:filamentous hemagglutinin N-terminal domain-containing protein [Bradyrhizobium sp.]